MALTGEYMSIPEQRWASHLVNHWADNTGGANYSVIRGYSASKDFAIMLNVFHLRTTRSNTRVWIEYVKSAENMFNILNTESARSRNHSPLSNNRRNSRNNFRLHSNNYQSKQ